MANKKARVAKTATEVLKILWEESFFGGGRRKLRLSKIWERRGTTFQMLNSGWL